MSNPKDNAPSFRRAALYIRVSTEEQAMRGLSLSAQRDTLTRYAQAHNLEVAGIYADEGVTARKSFRRRAAFMEMLEDVRAGRLDLILFIKLDRWFRSVADYYEVQRILDAHQVHWIATEENYDTATANGRLHLNIKLSIAQDESDRTAERIKFVFDSKLARGEVVSGKVPLGYRIQNKRLAVDPASAPIVRDMFRQYLALRSIRALGEYVMSVHGLSYSHSGLRGLLENRRYVGYAHGRADFCPPLIEAELFERVQELLAQRGQRGQTRSRRVYLFTGLVRCAECGGLLSAHTVSGKYVYYRCTRYEQGRRCPHRARTPEPVLERWLLDRLDACFANRALVLRRQPDPSPFQDSRLRLERRLEKLRELYLSDLIDREDYARDYAVLRARLLAQAPPPPPPGDALSGGRASELYAQLSPSLRRELWSRLLRRVAVTAGGHFSAEPLRHDHASPCAGAAPSGR